MMVYRMALFFACLGIMSGMVTGIMESGGTNWFDESNQNMVVSTINSSDVESIQMDSGSGVLDNVETTFKYTNIFWNVLKGVFLITAVLDDIFVYDVDGVNLFMPVLVLLQGMIYFIYISSMVQFVLNRSPKAYE